MAVIIIARKNTQTFTANKTDPGLPVQDCFSSKWQRFLQNGKTVNEPSQQFPFKISLFASTAMFSTDFGTADQNTHSYDPIYCHESAVGCPQPVFENVQVTSEAKTTYSYSTITINVSWTRNGEAENFWFCFPLFYFLWRKEATAGFCCQ